MVYKEELCTWFRDLQPHKRIDYMCGMLQMCLPMELRFMGSYVEDLAKKDFLELRESEGKANSLHELKKFSETDLRVFRTKMAVYLALLHSSNMSCSNIIFQLLDNRVLEALTVSEEIDVMTVHNILLVLSMAMNHPAFSYHQKTRMYDHYNNAKKAAERIQAMQKAEQDLLLSAETRDFRHCEQRLSPMCSPHIPAIHLIPSRVAPHPATHLTNTYGEKVHVCHIEVKSAHTIDAERNTTEYKLQVTWSNGEKKNIFKTYQELIEFHKRLKQEFPDGSHPQSIQLPLIKSGTQNHCKENTNLIGQYITSLLDLPDHIRQSHFFVTFFETMLHRPEMADACTSPRPPAFMDTSPRPPTFTDVPIVQHLQNAEVEANGMIDQQFNQLPSQALYSTYLSQSPMNGDMCSLSPHSPSHHELAYQEVGLSPSFSTKTTSPLMSSPCHSPVSSLESPSNSMPGSPSIHAREGTSLIHEKTGTGLIHDRGGTSLIHEKTGSSLIHDKEGTSLMNDIEGTSLIHGIEGISLLHNREGTSLLQNCKEEPALLNCDDNSLHNNESASSVNLEGHNSSISFEGHNSSISFEGHDSSVDLKELSSSVNLEGLDSSVNLEGQSSSVNLEGQRSSVNHEGHGLMNSEPRLDLTVTTLLKVNNLGQFAEPFIGYTLEQVFSMRTDDIENMSGAPRNIAAEIQRIVGEKMREKQPPCLNGPIEAAPHAGHMWHPCIHPQAALPPIPYHHPYQPVFNFPFHEVGDAPPGRELSPSNSECSSPSPSPHLLHMAAVRKPHLQLPQTDSSSDDGERDKRPGQYRSSSKWKGHAAPNSDRNVGPDRGSDMKYDTNSNSGTPPLSDPNNIYGNNGSSGYTSDPTYTRPQLLRGTYKAQPAHMNLQSQSKFLINMPENSFKGGAQSFVPMVMPQQLRDMTISSTSNQQNYNMSMGADFMGQRNMFLFQHNPHFLHTRGIFPQMNMSGQRPMFPPGSMPTGPAVNQTLVNPPQPTPINGNTQSVTCGGKMFHGAPPIPVNKASSLTMNGVDTNTGTQTPTSDLCSLRSQNSSVNAITSNSSTVTHTSGGITATTNRPASCTSCGCPGHNNQPQHPIQFMQPTMWPNPYSNGLLPVPAMPHPLYIHGHLQYPNGYNQDLMYGQQYGVQQPAPQGLSGVPNVMCGYNNYNNQTAPTTVYNQKRPRRINCHNCGSTKHLARECTEVSMEAMSGQTIFRPKNDSD